MSTSQSPKKEYEKGFERLRQKRKFNTFTRGTLTIVLSVVLVLIVLLTLVAVFFRVHEIKVEGNTIYEESDIIKSSKIKEGTNIYLLDSNKIKQNVMAKHPYIVDVKVVKNIPSTVVLNVTCDEPVFYVEVAGEYFVLTSELRIVERTSNIVDIQTKYPTVKQLLTTDVSSAIVGEKIVFVRTNYYNQLKEFLDILYTSEAFEGMTTVNFSDRFNIELVYNHNKKVEIGDITDCEIKLRFMYEIIKDLGDQSALIDVQDVETGYAIPGLDETYD